MIPVVSFLGSGAKKTYRGAKKAHRAAKPHVKRARKASKAVSRTAKQGKSDWGGIFKQAGFK